MRAPKSDLPLVLDDVSLQAGATTILNRLSLRINPGAPTLIVLIRRRSYLYGGTG